eukprot:1148903-Pelagomonas_calceolata.AAC.3
MWCTAVHCGALLCTVLQCGALRCIVVHCCALCFTAVHCGAHLNQDVGFVDLTVMEHTPCKPYRDVVHRTDVAALTGVSRWRRLGGRGRRKRQ